MSAPVAVRPVDPLPGPLDAVVRVPGSKSITNRALLCSALARGRSHLAGALVADDSDAMADCIRQLGGSVVLDRAAATVEVDGVDGRWPAAGASLDARLSGTTSRFVLPTLALGAGRYRLDGRPPLRRRPLDDVIAVLRSWDVEVVEHGEAGHLPVTVVGSGGVPGGEMTVAADRTSQFVSALLLAGPLGRHGLRLHLKGTVASRPYLDLTLGVMADFGAGGRWEGDDTVVVAPGHYRARRYDVEPDASSASYFLAAAAIAGGRVTVEGLGTASRQGDARFVDLLERLGARVERAPHRLTVTGGALHGADLDLRDQPDMAQTVAVLGVFADAPVTVRGVGIIRDHETDRIAAVVSELRRAGIDAREHDDGFTVQPGTPRPAVVRTYDDHRMAMSFALLGLRVPGIGIADPGCVAKTFPGFWDVLGSLTGGGARPGGDSAGGPTRVPEP